MTSHIATIQPHIVTFQHPSTAVVFTKNPSVMDSLCKSQGVRHPVGRRRNTNLHTSVFSTVPPLHWFSIFPRSSTSGRRCLHISYCSTDIHCYRLLAEQDLSTQEGDLPDSPEILHLMAQKEPHSSSTTSAPWNFVVYFLATPQSTPPPTRHPQRHYAIQATVPGFGLPQRGEDRRATLLRIYCPCCPCLYFEVLEHTFADTNPPLRRVPGTLDPNHHHEQSKYTRFKNILPVVYGSWARTPQRLRVAQTQEAISRWPTYCQLLFRPLQTDVQLCSETHLRAYSSGLSAQSGQR